MHHNSSAFAAPLTGLTLLQRVLGQVEEWPFIAPQGSLGPVQKCSEPAFMSSQKKEGEHSNFPLHELHEDLSARYIPNSLFGPTPHAVVPPHLMALGWCR